MVELPEHVMVELSSTALLENVLHSPVQVPRRLTSRLIHAVPCLGHGSCRETPWFTSILAGHVQTLSAAWLLALCSSPDAAGERTGCCAWSQQQRDTHEWERAELLLVLLLLSHEPRSSVTL